MRDPDIYWIPSRDGRLAIMPRPRAGEWLRDEIAAWRATGVTVVVSFPIPDRSVPASAVAACALI